MYQDDLKASLIKPDSSEATVHILNRHSRLQPCNALKRQCSNFHKHLRSGIIQIWQLSPDFRGGRSGESALDSSRVREAFALELSMVLDSDLPTASPSFLSTVGVRSIWSINPIMNCNSHNFMHHFRSVYSMLPMPRRPNGLLFLSS